ncbi:MAG TPA: trigger factor [Dehalococcoidia bacterium]|nr:trigger factor [Dehalococcoidia bacterium]
MKVSTEKIPDAQILMTIEVDSGRLDDARQKALRKLTPRAKVPGFRPGKAPPDLVRRYFGEERILDEALDALVPVVYREAVEADESIDPIARPRLVVETTEPLVVKATIPVRPTIELGDYRSVRVQTQEPTVDEARVDETLLIIRRRAATLEPIGRELRWGDVARLDLKADVDDTPLVQPQEAEIRLDEARDVLFPGFEEQLLGHRKGDVLEFDLPVPEAVTDEKFAGKQAHFTVTIGETKEEVLPDLDDDFAKQVGEGFESIAALRDRVRDDIRQNEEEQITNRYHDEILDQLLALATIEFPPVMLEAEIDRMLHDQAGHIERGDDLERYLAGIGKTEEEVRGELRPRADLRLRRSLLLGKVAEAENIDVSDEDLAAEVERLTAAAGSQSPQLRQLFDSDEGRGTIRRNLMTRQTLARLVEIATTAAAAAPAPPARKPRKKKSAPVEAPAGAEPAAATSQETE